MKTYNFDSVFSFRIGIKYIGVFAMCEFWT